MTPIGHNVSHSIFKFEILSNILVSVDKLEKRMNTIKGVRTKDYNEIKKELSDIRKEVVKLGK